MIFNIDPLLNQDLQNLRNLFQTQGFDLRFVGGCVRDHLAGKQPKDIDLCTDADPVEQISIYQNADIRHIPTGIDHGTITVVLDSGVYEITSLRLDVATDGRRATVAYTRDWLEDLARRDFTINAMSFTFDGVLIDPFDGYNDLLNYRVRFVGNADQRIKEDYLRILRWFRFRARYGIDPERDRTEYPADAKHIMANAAGLKSISRERVWSEIRQILAGPYGPKMILQIHQYDVAEFIDLPSECDWIYNAERLHSREPDPIAILHTLYGPVITRELLKKWKTSKEEQDWAEFVEAHQYKTDFNPYYLLAVDGVRRDWVCKMAKIFDIDAFDQAVLAEWPIPVFPVNGFDLMKLGMKPGPHYGKVIQALKHIWAKSGYTATKEQLLDKVDTTVYT
jgi:tRNA nucleotidyltransferase/poly(A) polymerase